MRGSKKRGVLARAAGARSIAGTYMIPAGLRPYVTHYYEFRNSRFLEFGTGIKRCYDPIGGTVMIQDTAAAQPAYDNTNFAQFDGADDQLVLASPVVLTPPYSIFALVKRTNALNTPLGSDLTDISLYKAGATVRHMGNSEIATYGGSLTTGSWLAEAVCAHPATFGLYQTTLVGADTSALPTQFSFQKMPGSVASSNYGLLNLGAIIVCDSTYFNQSNAESILASFENWETERGG
jgi:hypothetical protein